MESRSLHFGIILYEKGVQGFSHYRSNAKSYRNRIKATGKGGVRAPGICSWGA